MDSKTYLEEKIKQYDDVGVFQEGFAPVRKTTGKLGFIMKGFINESGDEVIPLKYHHVRWFNEGMAAVCIIKGGRYLWGYINTLGQEVIPLIYEKALSFKKGLAEVKLDDKWGIIDKTGRVVVPLEYRAIERYDDDLVKIGDCYDFNEEGFYNVKHDVEIPVGEYSFHSQAFSEGLAAVKQEDKWGFIDKCGKEVIPFTFDEAFNFNEDLAIVKISNQWAFINHAGQEVLLSDYDNVYSFCNGLALVCRKEQYGFINKKGIEVISSKYDFASSFNGDGFAVVQIGEKWGCIDISGKETVPINFDDITRDLFYESDDYKIVFYESGDYRIYPTVLWHYDEPDDKDFHHRTVQVLLNGKYGLFEMNGKELTPVKYDRKFLYSEGLAAVCHDGLWGYINKLGEEVIPLQYDDARTFYKGKAEVLKDGIWYEIDKTGKVL